jgi:hypothetical protein
MASMQKISLIAGSAAIAAALCGAPAQANMGEWTQAESSESGDAVLAEAVTAEAPEATVEIDMTAELEPTATSTDAEIAEIAPLTPVDAAIATDSAALALDDTVATDAGSLLAVQPESSPGTSAGEPVAQVTRPLYEGAPPIYVGVGGNIGIIESSRSAVGDFGFSVISKISLGPRFALRPSAVISEKRTAVTIPLTYNFRPMDVNGFAVHPYVGAGVDLSSEVGILLNGGVDVPISRQFTLNAQTNWRLSDDFGLGLTIGVGYNFPFFFE